MASHEETLAALQVASQRCIDIQGGITAQIQEVDNVLAQLLAALGNTEAGNMLGGQANQAKEAMSHAMAATAHLQESVNNTLQRFQGGI